MLQKQNDTLINSWSKWGCYKFDRCVCVYLSVAPNLFKKQVKRFERSFFILL